MNHDQIQREISIIKEMIEKTKKEIAESGYIFIIPGILLIIMVLTLHILEKTKLYHLILPILIISVFIVGFLSFLIGLRDERKEKVKTYPKIIFSQLWIACGISCIITGFIFPLLKVYPLNLIAIICWPIIGIGFYLTGVIYESGLIKWCSLAWWIGALTIAFLPDSFKLYLIISTIIIGYILPGLVLNKQYKNRSKKNEA